MSTSIVRFARKSRSPSRKSSQALRRLSFVETLETRQMLAANIFNLAPSPSTPSVLDSLEALASSRSLPEATHFYQVGDEKVGLHVATDRVALLPKPTVLSQEHGVIIDSLGMLETRPLAGSDFRVFSVERKADEQLMQTLVVSGFASEVVPVFEYAMNGSESVLLDEAIVRLSAGVEPGDFFEDERFTSYRSLLGSPDQFVVTLAAGKGEAALGVINELHKDSRAAWVTPNFHHAWERFFTPNDTRWANLWTMKNTGQTAPGGVPGLAGADVNMEDAWAIQQGVSSSMIIGVLDDGVAINHPDLFNYNSGESSVFPDSEDLNGNGWIGDRHGWNFVANNANSSPTNAGDNHGTAVAGIAAARGNNSLGVVGSGFGAQVLAAKMFEGSAVASVAGISSALYYLAGRTANGLGQWNAATVVNHSWGGGAPSAAITDALTWATTEARGGLGVPQFFASGNSPGLVGNPANLSATNPGIIVIGGLNNAGQLTSYHARGPLLDVVTPTNEFLQGYLAVDTTDRLGAEGYNTASDYTGTGAAGFGGTSAASPLAAGIGALAMARAAELSIDLTAADLRKLIRNNTRLAGDAFYDIFDSGKSFAGGYGLMDAGSLLEGIGVAKLSVTTSLAEVENGSSGWTLDERFVDSTTEFTLRIRNQGTQTLDLTSVSLSGSPAYEVVSLSETSLELGGSALLTLRFLPTTEGMHTSNVLIVSTDPTTPSFQFTIEAQAIPAQVSGYVFEDRNGSGTQSAGELPVQTTVLFDTNGNGVVDTFGTSNFTATPGTSFGPNDIISPMTVSGISGFVTDINVQVNITHTWVADIVLFLEAPNGDFVQLFNQRGGSGDNLTNTIFDDSAANPISAGTAPFTGAFRPEQPLSLFNGLSAEDTNGEWQLYVFDLFAGDDGVLVDWRLEISSGELAVNTDSFGFYGATGLEAGSYAVTVMDSQWMAPAGAASSYAVSITGTNDVNRGSDFAIGRVDRFYGFVFDDSDGDGSIGGGESPKADRVMFFDGNKNGILDAPSSATFNKSTSMPISDFVTSDDPLVVAGAGMVLLDTRVTVNLTHTWMADLQIWLVAPDGDSVQLFNRHGGSGDNLVSTVFDDSAAASISTGTAPFTGTWRPIAPLSTLIGKNPNGTWNLRIRDNAGGDVGTLTSWSLTLSTSSDVVYSTSDDGWLAVDLPSTGTHDMLLTDEGLQFTVPADGKRTVTAGTPHFAQTFGERAIPATIGSTYVMHAGGTVFTGNARIDTSKALAKEGPAAQTLSFANLINTTRGINMVAMEMSGLPGALTADDFVFQMSPQGSFLEAANPPADWAAAPAPSDVAMDTAGGNDRVIVSWPNNAIENRWLRITVLANANTRLAAPEVYYIGHLRGEVNGLVQGGQYVVNNADAIAIAGRVSGVAVPVTNQFDLDKNGRVLNADILAMAPFIGGLRLRNITIQSSVGGSFGRSLAIGLGKGDSDRAVGQLHDSADVSTSNANRLRGTLDASSSLIAKATDAVFNLWATPDIETLPGTADIGKRLAKTH